jgi:hypothetical protein
VVVHNLCIIIVIVYSRHRIPDDWLIVQKTKYRQLPDPSCFSIEQESVVPSASVTMPATASPCRFSMVAWPI